MNIKQTRKDMKLSTAEFGELLGVSGRTIEHWEQGRKPNKSALMLLSELIKKEDKKGRQK